MSSEAFKTAAEAAPSTAAAVSILVFGITLNEWVAILSIVFIVIQTLYLGWRWLRDVRREREGLPSLKDGQ